MNRITGEIFASMFLVGVLGVAQAAQPPKTTENRPAGTFQVKVSNGYLSLNAEDAPLNQIFKEIGRQARITFDSNVGPEKKITTRLDRVPLEDGIRQLAKNVSVFYTQDTKTNSRRIARVVVLEPGGVSGQAKAPSKSDKANEPSPQPAKVDKPQPFKFEFDPAKSAEKKPAPGTKP